MLELAWPGLAIGFLGSLHCIGMCGPIALALPRQNGSRLRLLLGRILYNSGRVLTYGLLGIAAGLLGEVVRFASLQQALSITAGVALLLAVFLPSRLARRVIPGNLVDRLVVRFTKAAGVLFKSRTIGALFAIGFLNGLLPCGLVYVALAGAAATGDKLAGGTFMILFGLGTVPVMVAVSLVGPLLSVRLRRALTRLIPVGAVALAALLILRGMSLGIPYISPRLDSDRAMHQANHCH
jgi:sulfite exporter TauE/SafE